MPEEHRLVYVADPMCSWCWGFSPVIKSITERFGSQTPVTLVLGGLAPGITAPMNDAAKSTVREHWNHVHQATGQPFDFGFFDRKGFVYDTEPPSRAVVAARLLHPDHALPFLAHLHAAFYRDNQDLTHAETLCDLAATFGIDRTIFARQLADEATHLATRKDFALTRKLGISGFPSLIGHDGERFTAITIGYRPLEYVTTAIHAWLQGAVLSRSAGNTSR